MNRIKCRVQSVLSGFSRVFPGSARSRAAGGRHCRVTVRDSVSKKLSAGYSPAISCASSLAF